MPTKYRDYAGMFPNYQALGNVKAQSYQNNANSVSQLLQALSQIAQANQEKEQQGLDQNAVNSALFQTTQSRQPQANPSISPMMQSRGNQINDVAGFNAVSNAPTFQSQQTFNPQMERLAPLLTNPRTAPLVMSVINGSKAMQGTTTQESPYENTIRTDAFGRRSVLSKAQEKPDNTMTETELYYKAVSGDPIAEQALQKRTGMRVDEYKNKLGASEQSKINIFKATRVPTYTMSVQQDADGTFTVLRGNSRNPDDVQVVKTGIKYKPADMAKINENAQKIDAFQNSLEQYEDVLRSVDSGRIGGTIAKGQAMVGVNDAARTAAGLRNSIAGAISRVLNGEVGVLTDQDVQRALTMLPTEIDTESERAYKFATINELLRQRVEAYQKGIDGGFNKDSKPNNPVSTPKKQVKRRGTSNGRRVVEYMDGTIEYSKQSTNTCLEVERN